MHRLMTLKKIIICLGLCLTISLCVHADLKKKTTAMTVKAAAAAISHQRPAVTQQAFYYKQKECQLRHDIQQLPIKGRLHRQVKRIVKAINKDRSIRSRIQRLENLRSKIVKKHSKEKR